jgi:tripartite ATP-independent transporter DctM subunit
MVVVFLVALFTLFGLGTPVAFGIGLASLAIFLLKGLPLVAVAQRMIGGLDNFPILAVPFSLLAGALMNTGGVTRRLIELASAMVGHIRGGLAHVVIVANMIMAGMSGSAVADASGTGTILIPAMTRSGYPRPFAAAVVGAAATIGPIIPPSIPMVLYASISEVSTGRLFLGGVVPGTIMGLYLMAAAYLISRRRGYGSQAGFSLLRLGRAVRDGLLPLFTPVIILGGIFLGFFTPTEAAVIAVAYALCLGILYRELTLRKLWHVLVEVASTTAAVGLILATSSLSGWVAAMEQLPQALASFFLSITTSPTWLLAILNVFLLLLGCIMDSPPIIFILTPILAPLVAQYGIDPIHFGVVMVLNLMIGLITPPVGMVMYVTSGIAGIRMDEFVREVWPFFVALVLVLATITAVPALVTFLPNHLMAPR